ncbi:hypothetical protein [Streptomyces hygroscopicus]|uniref:hypothetical protein n=1 Tax=Streptomyces hygroscopicus TaxID=1912 RepID=UPI00131D9FF2|nr:hypothetical protein [Streptomyces hygroscopicus]
MSALGARRGAGTARAQLGGARHGTAWRKGRAQRTAVGPRFVLADAATRLEEPDPAARSQDTSG